MCKVQTQLHELLSIEEKDFLSKLDLLSSNEIELLIKNIKLRENSNNFKDKENKELK